jgi:hypothetical protein
MEIRFYRDVDYQKLIELYKKSDEFEVDPVTDSQENLSRKITRDPESILVAFSDDEIVGSVSIIEDGRIALLFRLVVDESRPDSDQILGLLINKAESILKSRGCKEVHNTAPSDRPSSQGKRTNLGFTKGKEYSWFWKKIE